MIGADPKFPACEFASLLPSGGSIPGRAAGRGSIVSRWRLAAIAAFLIPLSLTLAQSDQAPNAGALAANAATAQVSPSAGTFEERFPSPSFSDRFPTATESFEQRLTQDSAIDRTPQAEPATYKVASIDPQAPYQRPPSRQELTTLVSMKSSAFP